MKYQQYIPPTTGHVTQKPHCSNKVQLKDALVHVHLLYAHVSTHPVLPTKPKLQRDSNHYNPKTTTTTTTTTEKQPMRSLSSCLLPHSPHYIAVPPPKLAPNELYCPSFLRYDPFIKFDPHHIPILFSPQLLDLLRSLTSLLSLFYLLDLVSSLHKVPATGPSVHPGYHC